MARLGLEGLKTLIDTLIKDSSLQKGIKHSKKKQVPSRYVVKKSISPTSNDYYLHKTSYLPIRVSHSIIVKRILVYTTGQEPRLTFDISDSESAMYHISVHHIRPKNCKFVMSHPFAYDSTTGTLSLKVEFLNTETDYALTILQSVTNEHLKWNIFLDDFENIKPNFNMGHFYFLGSCSDGVHAKYKKKKKRLRLVKEDKVFGKWNLKNWSGYWVSYYKDIRCVMPYFMQKK